MGCTSRLRRSRCASPAGMTGGSGIARSGYEVGRKRIDDLQPSRIDELLQSEITFRAQRGVQHVEHRRGTDENERADPIAIERAIACAAEREAVETRALADDDGALLEEAILFARTDIAYGPVCDLVRDAQIAVHEREHAVRAEALRQFAGHRDERRHFAFVDADQLA